MISHLCFAFLLDVLACACQHLNNYSYEMQGKPWLFGSLLVFIMHRYIGCADKCRLAEYAVGGECCPMCSPGNRVHKHCTEFSSTSCIPCTEGTFLDQPSGNTQCFSCTNCDTDTGLKVKRPCTTTSDATCESLEGFYCKDRREDGCIEAQRHNTCKPGQYISRRGTSSTDTVCADCTGGTYSNGTFTTCQPHTDCKSIGRPLIKIGTRSSDSTCEESSNSETNVGGVVGGVIGILLSLLLIITLFLLYRHRLRKREGRFQVPQQVTSELSQPDSQDAI